MRDVVTIVVIDDHPIFRSGMVQLLQLEERFVVVAEGATAAEAVSLVEQHKPQILTLDLSMDESGLGVIAPARRASPDTSIIVLTASDAAYDVQTSLELGVEGYILKGAGGSEIMDAIDMVAAGQKFISPRAISRALASSQAPEAQAKQKLSTLSARELTVLAMISQGLSNREIGQRLGIQEKSVKFHVTNIFARLGVRNRVEATIVFRATS